MSDFSISEFLIDQDNELVNVEVADKIAKYHIPIIQQVRTKLGCAIWPSKHSGYRPIWWEIKHNRSGLSEHCFNGKGAVDYRCRNKWQLVLMLEELKKSKYMRVCYYPNNNFIHCDFKGDEKLSFICENGTDWVV